jgi:CheY-like chemotaxis protein
MPTCTVLILDDEKAIRDAVRWTLEDAGYAVLEASDGDEGLHLLRASEEPLIVLLDLMMPGTSGLEVLHALEADPVVAARHAFIIFSAARAFIAPVLNLFLPDKRLLSLPKPFPLDLLITTVEQAAQQLDCARDGDDDETTMPVAEPLREADLADQTQPVFSGVEAGSDHLHQRRALLDAIVMRAHALRTLHQQFMALPRPQESSYERREKLLQFLHDEQAVLAESQRLHDQLDALLRVRRVVMVHAYSPQEAARLSARTPDARTE